MRYLRVTPAQKTPLTYAIEGPTACSSLATTSSAGYPTRAVTVRLQRRGPLLIDRPLQNHGVFAGFAAGMRYLIARCPAPGHHGARSAAGREVDKERYVGLRAGSDDALAGGQLASPGVGVTGVP